MKEVRTLFLPHLFRPLVFADSRAVEEAFRTLFKGREARSGTPEDAETAIIRVVSGAEGYHLECAWLARSRRFVHPVDAACALIAEVAQAMLVEDPALLCLHCAAVEIGDRLVILPSDYGAGKSLLAACLASRGHRVFADDLLPLVARDGGDLGRATGFAPRLRLPFPDRLRRDTLAFFDAHRGPASERYRYLELGAKHLAPFGTEAAIRDFILLERDGEPEPRLIEAGVGEILRHVVTRNFARDLPASTILRRLHRLVARAGRFRLCYKNTEDAVKLLVDASSNWSHPVSSAALGESVPCCDGARPPPEIAVPPGSYLRHPGVSAFEIEGETFLIDPHDRSIHHLNPMANALWRLFAEPTSLTQAAAIVHAAFPDLSSAQCEADLKRLTQRLRRNGLVLSGEDRRP